MKNIQDEINKAREAREAIVYPIFNEIDLAWITQDFSHPRKIKSIT